MTFPFSCYILGSNGVFPTLTKKKNVTDYLMLSKYLRLVGSKAIICVLKLMPILFLLPYPYLKLLYSPGFYESAGTPERSHFKVIYVV